MIYRNIKRLGGVVGSLVVCVTGTELLWKRCRNGIKKAKQVRDRVTFHKVQVYSMHPDKHEPMYMVYDPKNKVFYANEGCPHIKFDTFVPIEDFVMEILRTDNADALEAHLKIPAFKKEFYRLVKMAEPSVEGDRIIWKLPNQQQEGLQL